MRSVRVATSLHLFTQESLVYSTKRRESINPIGGYIEQDFIAEFYDFVDVDANRGDVAFFVEEAKVARGAVLELGCGTGRVLIPTARSGVAITGLDFSPLMLKVCRDRLVQEPVEVQSRVQLVQGDIRDFAFDRPFALVTIPFRPFQHLVTVEDQLACLECIHRHLVPRGRLILDIFNPWLELIVADNCGKEFGEEPPFTLPDGRTVIRRHKFVSKDRIRQVNRHDIIYDISYPDGRVEKLVHTFDLRYIFRYEAEHLLVRACFKVEQLYSDYDKSAYGAKYPGELIFVAVRR